MEVVLIFGQCGLESSCPRGAITTPIRGVDLSRLSDFLKNF